MPNPLSKIIPEEFLTSVSMLLFTTNRYRISRYWNRLAFKVIDFGVKMIWDYSGQNTDLIKEINRNSSVREILTAIPSNCILGRSFKDTLEKNIDGIDKEALKKRVDDGDVVAKALSMHIALYRIEPNNHIYRSTLRAAYDKYIRSLKE